MVAKPRILVVDDEPVVRESLRDWFANDGYPVDMAADAREALRKLQEYSWDILLTDVKMPGMDGLELQQKVKQIDPDLTVIIMTAFASVDSAMQAIKEGAYDYVIKPLDPEDLEQIINRASERRMLVRENLQLKQRIETVTGEGDQIIGNAPEIRRVRELIQKLASTETPVLITGERGTGKDLVARCIHRASRRHHMPLVTLKFSGVPESQLRSELFGHEPGAVPGGEHQRKGKLELADGTSAFFEEIGDVSPEIQTELERVLEQKTVTRVGGRAMPIPVDLRVIAAAESDLERAVERGDFRRSLYDRLNDCGIALPPLRERPSDIPSLARYFLQKSAGDAVPISAAAMQLLMDYAWPGNVDELRNVVERASALRQGEEILPGDLPLASAEEARPASGRSLADAEKRHIQRVLEEMSGDLPRAARELQIDESTLAEKIRELGLDAPRQ
jgi:DNA-binding NtrC family response regulator